MDKGQILLGRRQVMEVMGWSSATLWRALQRGVFPQPLRLPGCHPRWRMSDIEGLLQKR